MRRSKPQHRRVQRRGPQRSLRSNGPPQLRTNLEHSHQFRFISTSGTPTAISDLHLMLACGVSASSTTVGHAIRGTVRVNQIEIWSPPSAQGAAVTCSVLFPASQRSSAREVTDTSVSVATPAHVRCGPPAESLCGFWTQGDGQAGTMFTLTAPVGSLIDVWIGMVDLDGDSAAIGNATLVGATVGSVYYCALDSGILASAIYKPVGLTAL